MNSTRPLKRPNFGRRWRPALAFSSRSLAWDGEDLQKLSQFDLPKICRFTLKLKIINKMKTKIWDGFWTWGLWVSRFFGQSQLEKGNTCRKKTWWWKQWFPAFVPSIQPTEGFCWFFAKMNMIWMENPKKWWILCHFSWFDRKKPLNANMVVAFQEHLQWIFMNDGCNQPWV